MTFSTITSAAMVKTGTMIFGKYVYTVLANNFANKTITLKKGFSGEIVEKPYSMINGFVAVSE